ncbi:hypothetical protein K0M31_002704 [Melipona bicolor]|uniref:Uncharacterized protein n=1 Tax=Melipona bicolor TaxID=60889 RepID=A0AA40KPR1_9HYME|nr:hypothetical protein K0M31_002704 [Melipona bicolor]
MHSHGPVNAFHSEDRNDQVQTRIMYQTFDHIRIDIIHISQENSSVSIVSQLSRFCRFPIAALLKDIFNKASSTITHFSKCALVSLAHFSQGLQFERAFASTIEAKKITTAQYQLIVWRKTLLGFGRISRLTVFS